MQTDPDIMRIVRSWLRTDEHESADRVRKAVLAQLDTTTQRRSWSSARRFAQMNNVIKLAAATVAVVLVVVVGMTLLAGSGQHTGAPAAATPNAPAAATPNAPAAATPVALTVGPSVAPSRPAGSLPPLSTSAWTGLTVTDLSNPPYGDVPQNPRLVVRWAGGYVVVTSWTWEAGAMGVWESPDGRTWTAQPASLFGLDDPSTYTSGTECGDKVLIETGVTTPEGVTVSRWSSSDGTAWTQAPLHNEGFGQLAGWGQVAVAAVDTGASAANGMALDVTTDCSTWQRVALPGPAVGQITNVTASGGGFVAVGYSGPPASTGSEPLAWWSSDGLHWSAAKVPASSGHRFVQIWAGGGGYLGTMTSVGSTPALETLWVSTDGHSWAPTTSDPLGTIQAGEGVGSLAGFFDGDGTRLLAYGPPGGTPPQAAGGYQYWVSSDGTHWTRLALTGPGVAALTEYYRDDAWPPGWLMRDGILFVRPNTIDRAQPVWFGAATP
jgi:hypothetical protein